MPGIRLGGGREGGREGEREREREGGGGDRGGERERERERGEYYTTDHVLRPKLIWKKWSDLSCIIPLTSFNHI